MPRCPASGDDGLTTYLDTFCLRRQMMMTTMMTAATPAMMRIVDTSMRTLLSSWGSFLLLRRTRGSAGSVKSLLQLAKVPNQADHCRT